MDRKECFVFSRSDLISSSFSTFVEMRKNEELIDFKIKFGSRSFKAHRLILAASIPYFRTKFSEADEDMALNQVNTEALESIINFAYSGEIEITSQNVQSLLFTSQHLQLGQLSDACLEFLESKLDVKNVLRMRSLAETQNCLRLRDISDRYIRENFQSFSSCESFLHLPFQLLKEIISRDDIKVNKEEIVFEAVIRWIKVSPSERKDLLPELLREVRMSHLTHDFMIRRIWSEELVQKSSICKALMKEASNHLLLVRKESVSRSFNIRPRMYEKTSRPITADNGCGIYALCCSGSEISVNSLHLEKQKWISLSNCRNKFVQHAVAFNGMIYIFFNETTETFDLKTLKWHTLDTQVQNLLLSGVVEHKSVVYFFGGRNSLSDTVLRFDLTTNTWISKLETTRPLVQPGVASLREFVYVTGGGSDSSTYDSCRTTERYNHETQKWEKISPMLTARRGHGCTALKDKIYACGGWNQACATNTTEIYDPLTNRWNFVSSMREPKYILSLISNKGKLYALQRWRTQCVEVYDPQYDWWKSCVPVPGDSECRNFLVSEDIRSVSQKNDPVEAETSEICENVSKDLVKDRLRSVEELKKLGNSLYNIKSYKEAIEKYTEALDGCKSLRTMLKDKEDWETMKKMKILLLSNISQCKLRENDYYSTIQYSTEVLEIDPGNVKALYRRARAYVGLRKFAESEADYQKILKLDLDPSLISTVHQELKNVEVLRIHLEETLHK